jgi:predicted nucleotidyltransferase
VSYLGTLRSRAKMVEGWKVWARKVANAAKTIMPDARVYVFGSVIRGGATGGSDVDMLIVSQNVPRKVLERSRIKVKIEDMAGLPIYHPFEIHLATEDESEQYLAVAGKHIVKIG